MSTGTSTAERPTMFWTREYLLGHCEGYLVSTPDEHVGFVEAIVRDPRSEAPTSLIVRGDLGVTTVPIDRVAELRPEAEEIVLAGDQG